MAVTASSALDVANTTDRAKSGNRRIPWPKPDRIKEARWFKHTKISNFDKNFCRIFDHLPRWFCFIDFHSCTCHHHSMRYMLLLRFSDDYYEIAEQCLVVESSLGKLLEQRASASLDHFPYPWQVSVFGILELFFFTPTPLIYKLSSGKSHQSPSMVWIFQILNNELNDAFKVGYTFSICTVHCDL